MIMYILYFFIGTFWGSLINKILDSAYKHQLPFVRRMALYIVTGFLFVQCISILNPSMQLLRALLYTSFLIIISIIDYESGLIYDKVLLPMLISGFVLNIYCSAVSWPNMLSAALLGGSIFLLLIVVSKGGFGGGDVKFMACIGLWLGLKYTILAVILSLILGGFGAAILLLIKRKKITDTFPYGPYIAIASFISMLYGDCILTWYWN